MQLMRASISDGMVSTKIKTDNKSITVYITGIIAYCLLIYPAVFIFKGYAGLSTVSVIYWMVALMPVMLTKSNWIHPLTFQMIYELPKVLSLGCRACGFVPLDYKWHAADYTLQDCMNAYIFCVFVTCLCLMIEYFVFFNWNIRFKKKEIYLGRRASVEILFFIAITAFVILIHRLGGIGYIFANYAKRLSEYGANTSLYLRNLIYYGIIYILYAYLTENKRRALIASVIQVFMFITLGERGGLISALILPFIVLYQLDRNRCMKTSTVIAGGAALVFIYMVFGTLRTPAADSTPANIINRLAVTFSSIEHFVIPSELLYLLNTDRAEYLFGRPLLNIFAAPFPRRYFPWKPAYIADSVVVGEIILRGSGRNVFGLPPGTFAYGYLNFGIIGALIFALISGVFAKYFYESLIKPYWGRVKIPSGNILIYALLIQYICDILSTEVQIKLIIYGAGILLVEILARRKKEYCNQV